MLNDDSIIYHYCSVDAFVNILKTHSIWLTHAREMNDFREDILFSKPLKTALQSFENRSVPEKTLFICLQELHSKLFLIIKNKENAYRSDTIRQKDHTADFSSLLCGLCSLCRPKESRSKICFSAYP